MLAGEAVSPALSLAPHSKHPERAQAFSYRFSGVLRPENGEWGYAGGTADLQTGPSPPPWSL